LKRLDLRSARRGPLRRVELGLQILDGGRGECALLRELLLAIELQLDLRVTCARRAAFAFAPRARSLLEESSVIRSPRSRSSFTSPTRRDEHLRADLEWVCGTT